MKKFLECWLPVFLLLLLLSGCKEKISDGKSPLFQSSELSESVQQQNNEAFESTFQLFNALEESPALLGLPGESEELQMLGQLDKWLAFRTTDKFWKNDPYYQELEKTFRDKLQKIESLLASFQTLQKEEETPGTPVDLPKLLEGLKGLSEDMTRLGALGEIDFSGEQQAIKDLLDRFSKIRSIQEAAILASAEQIKADIERLSMLQANLSIFANLLLIDRMSFQPADTDHLKQVVWTKNISSWARGNKQGDIDRALALFDWTVRNIDLRADATVLPSGQRVEAPAQEPWETLLLGEGTMLDRAWVFIELLRQQRIDAGILCIEKPDAPGGVLPWAVGVLSEGEIYLFVPSYGLAVPGPQGIRLTPVATGGTENHTGELEYQDVATLAQVIENDSLLRKLDSDAAPLPITSETVKNSVLWLVGSPCSNAQRMSIVQRELSGEETMVLYQSYLDQEARFSKVAGISRIEHWRRPIRAMYERQTRPEWVDQKMTPFRFTEPFNKRFSLWTARVLYFQGKLSGTDSAITSYQDARVSDRRLRELSQDAGFHMTPEKLNLYLVAKRYAQYWIAITCYELGKINSAKEYLEDEEKDPVSLSGQLWSNAIAYNLGRIYEKSGRYEDAIARYKKNPRSPLGFGNAVRAKWVKELSAHNKEPSN